MNDKINKLSNEAVANHVMNDHEISQADWCKHVCKQVDLSKYVSKDALAALKDLNVKLLLDNKLIRTHNEASVYAIKSLMQECLPDNKYNISDQVQHVDRASVDQSVIWLVDMQIEAVWAVLSGWEDRSYSLNGLIERAVRQDYEELHYV